MKLLFFIFVIALIPASCKKTSKDPSVDASGAGSTGSGAQAIDPEAEVSITAANIEIIIPAGTFSVPVTGEITTASRSSENVSAQDTLDSFDVLFRNEDGTAAEPAGAYSVISTVSQESISNPDDIFIVVINQSTGTETIIPNDQLIITDDGNGGYDISFELDIGEATIIVAESPESSTALLDIATLGTQTSLPFVVDWPDVTGASAYHVKIGTASGCPVSFGERTVTASEFELDDLLSGNYYVCVTASDGNTDLSTGEEPVTVSYSPTPGSMAIFYSWNDNTGNTDYYDISIGSSSGWNNYNVYSRVGNVDVMTVALAKTSTEYHVRFQQHEGANTSNVLRTNTANPASWPATTNIDGGPEDSVDNTREKVAGKFIASRNYGNTFYSVWHKSHQFDSDAPFLGIRTQIGDGTIANAKVLTPALGTTIDDIKMSIQGQAVDIVYSKTESAITTTHHLHSSDGSWGGGATETDITASFDCNGDRPRDTSLAALNNNRLAFVYNCNDGVGGYDLKVKYYENNSWSSTSFVIDNQATLLRPVSTTVDSNGGLHVAYKKNDIDIRYATDAQGADITADYLVVGSAMNSAHQIGITTGGLVAIFYIYDTGLTDYELRVVYGNNSSWSTGYTIDALPNSGDDYFDLASPIDSL